MEWYAFAKEPGFWVTLGVVVVAVYFVKGLLEENFSSAVKVTDIAAAGPGVDSAPVQKLVTTASKKSAFMAFLIGFLVFWGLHAIGVPFPRFTKEDTAKTVSSTHVVVVDPPDLAMWDWQEATVKKAGKDIKVYTVVVKTTPVDNQWAEKHPGGMSFFASKYVVPDGVVPDAVELFFQHKDGRTSASVKAKK